MMRRTLLGLAAVSSLAFAMMQPAYAESTKVRIMYTASSAFAAVFVAADKGFFERNGIDAEMSIGQNGSVILSGVVSGSVEVGLPTPTVVMQATQNGLDLRLFAATNVFPDPTASGLIVGTESGIRTPADTAGKKIGVPGIGGLIDVVLRKWINQNGGDPAKVSIVEYSLPQTADVLRSKQVDGAATLDPFLSRAVESGAGVSIGNYTDIIPAGTAAGVLTTTAAWAEANPKAIENMQRALKEAAEFIVQKPDEARESIGRFTTLPPPVLKGMNLPNVADLSLTPEKFQFWQDIALEQGLISEPVDLDTLLIPFPKQ